MAASYHTSHALEHSGTGSTDYRAEAVYAVVLKPNEGFGGVARHTGLL